MAVAGGGIFNTNGGNNDRGESAVVAGLLTIIDSTIDNNYTGFGPQRGQVNSPQAAFGGPGGGIANYGGQTTLTRSTVSNNNTNGAYGGGIYTTAVFFNRPAGEVAAVGSLILVNSTVSQNSTTFDREPPTSPQGGDSGAGGGIYNFASFVSVTDSTITANETGAPEGAGIFNEIPAGRTNSPNGFGIGTVEVKNSIIADNTRNLEPVRPNGGTSDVFGSFTSQGFNLIGNKGSTVAFVNGVNNDQVGDAESPIDPLLARLANNGGFTRTHRLLVGSPAIDKGSSTNTTDQRGSPRPVDDPNLTPDPGNSSDIGAFEAPLPPLACATEYTQSTPAFDYQEINQTGTFLDLSDDQVSSSDSARLLIQFLWI